MIKTDPAFYLGLPPQYHGDDGDDGDDDGAAYDDDGAGKYDQNY